MKDFSCLPKWADLIKSQHFIGSSLQIGIGCGLADIESLYHGISGFGVHEIGDDLVRIHIQDTIRRVRILTQVSIGIYP